MFSLYSDVISSQPPYYFYERVEEMRSNLLASKQTIVIEDYGAGSKKHRSNSKRAVSDIARHSLKPAKYGQLLFRLVNAYKPKNILELGTSLGITTSYLAGADSGIQVVSVEGCPQTAAVAKTVLQDLNIVNVDLVNAKFDDFLPDFLEKTPSLDFVFFDGNHTKTATLHYFELCLEKSHDNSLFIFDDIHWSKGMEEAWVIIKDHAKVKATVDLYGVGLVIFNKDLSKENFVLKF